MVALGLFFTKQKQSILGLEQRRDRTIGLLYRLAKEIFEDECAVEKDKLDVLFDVCDQMEKQIGKIIASARDPHQQSNSCSISYAEDALGYLRTCKRKYQSIDSTEPTSPMPESKDLPEKTKRRQEGPRNDDLLPDAGKHSAPDFLFIEAFMASLGKKRMNWKTCFERGRATGAFRNYEDHNSLKAHYHEKRRKTVT